MTFISLIHQNLWLLDICFIVKGIPMCNPASLGLVSVYTGTDVVPISIFLLKLLV